MIFSFHAMDEPWDGLSSLPVVLGKWRACAFARNR